MDTLSPSMRDLAQRLLIASKTASAPAGKGDAHVHDVVKMCETLRLSLTTFAGADGFASLLRRAVTLAGEEAPSLKNVKLGSNCHMEGLEGIEPEAGVALAAHLLGLLVVFIGEPLTLRLVREAWPDAALDDVHSRKEVHG